MDTKKFIKEKLIEGLVEQTANKLAAGVLIKCSETDNVLLLLRNDRRPIWSLMSGTIEKGEDIFHGLQREIVEELSINPNLIKYNYVGIDDSEVNGFIFHYYEGLTNTEFKPILDSENLKYGWFSKDNLPSPLYNGLAEKISKL